MVIATRVLTLRGEGGDTDVPIRIFAPEPDDRCWRCRYEVEWPDETFKSQAYGEDAVQAIELAFQKIGVELYVSEEHKSGRLGWGEPGNGYGFPVAKSIRDLLVGHDKKFYGE
jgi:hypothetical protein